LGLLAAHFQVFSSLHQQLFDNSSLSMLWQTQYEQLLVGLRQNRGVKKGIMLFQHSFHVKLNADERDNTRSHAPVL
jgi:hypothetical protein